MRGEAHIYGALAVFSVYSLHQGSIDLIVGAFSIVGGLLPDIDANFCLLERLIISKPIKFTFAAIDDLIGKNVYTKHRGVLMHSAWTVLVFLLASIVTSGHMHKITLGALIGIVSHHALDAPTKAGLKLYFYPFKREDVNLCNTKKLK